MGFWCFVPGQVIIDKNPGITCVVNKTNTIDSTYRNFQMEVLAGENNMVAKVSSSYSQHIQLHQFSKIHLSVFYLLSSLRYVRMAYFTSLISLMCTGTLD